VTSVDIELVQMGVLLHVHCREWFTRDPLGESHEQLLGRSARFISDALEDFRALNVFEEFLFVHL
jgi:hypothetical protein